MRRIDLNVDIGEGFEFDGELAKLATSANVCCGAYAGSTEITTTAVEICQRENVRIGAHPGYPDRESMGRRTLDLSEHLLRELVRASIRDQMAAFCAIVHPAYVKPHGALYGQASSPGMAADIVRDLLREFGLPLMGLAKTAHEDSARTAGVPLIREGFADRAYGLDGRLVPRSDPGAVLSDLKAIESQVLRLATRVDSICLHGDTPGCVEIAAHVRFVLERAGYEVGA